MSLFDRMALFFNRKPRAEYKRLGRACPHCGWASVIRSSEQKAPTYSEQLRLCQNPLCGHIWIDAVEAHRTLSPSAIPNPEVFIPLSKHIKRDSVIRVMQRQNPLEQLDLLPEAPAKQETPHDAP